MAKSIPGMYRSNPLVDLHCTEEHIGKAVMLIALVQQVMATEDITTRKGTKVCKTCVKIGDETRSYFGVVLWQDCARKQFQVGDILLLDIDIVIHSFRGRTEGSSQRQSVVLVLLKCQQLAEGKGLDDVVNRTSGDQDVKKRLSIVLEWAVTKQATLISLASKHFGHKLLVPAGRNGTSSEPVGCKLRKEIDHGEETGKETWEEKGKEMELLMLQSGLPVREEGQSICSERKLKNVHEQNEAFKVIKLEYLAKVDSLGSSAVFEVNAWVSQLVFPPLHQGDSGSRNWGMPWCREGGPMLESNRQALASLIGYGCLDCGRELLDGSTSCPCWDEELTDVWKMRHSVTTCESLNGTSNYGCNRVRALGSIYRPFFIELWDETSQIVALVPNSVAQEIFAGIQAGSLKSRSLTSNTSSYGTKSDKSCESFGSEGDIDLEMVVLMLISALLLSGKNSKFQFFIRYLPLSGIDRVWSFGSYPRCDLELVGFSASPPATTVSRKRAVNLTNEGDGEGERVREGEGERAEGEGVAL